MFHALRWCLALSCMVVAPSIARADLIFSIGKTPTGPIFLGTSATFDILVRTNTGTQAFGLLGFDVTLNPADGSGGVLEIPATGANLIGGGGWFKNGTTFEFDGAASAAIASFNTMDTKIATITLNTVGAVIGSNYQVSIGNINALEANFTPISATAAAPLNYSITAVPEPGSIALLCFAGTGLLVRYRRRPMIALP